MKKHLSIKTNKFDYVYDDFTKDLIIYYQGYEVSTITNVTPRRVESAFKMFVKDYIRETRGS